jgi:carbonic anhydrase
MIERAKNALYTLMEGNRRFREGVPHRVAYTQSALAELAKVQRPIAAIIGCSDARTAPEIIFDQPLGAIFSSRVPGNVAADSAKWMLQIAVDEFDVPLVMVLGHTGCLAVGQLLEGDKGGAGGSHRFDVANAVYRARHRRPDDLYLESICENARQTCDFLLRDSQSLRSSALQQRSALVSAYYRMDTGEVVLLEEHGDR